MNEVSSAGIPLDNKPFVFGDKIMNRDIRPETRIIVKLKNQTIVELNGTTVALDREDDFSPKYHERITPVEATEEKAIEPATTLSDETKEEAVEEAPKKKAVKKSTTKKAKK